LPFNGIFILNPNFNKDNKKIPLGLQIVIHESIYQKANKTPFINFLRFPFHLILFLRYRADWGAGLAGKGHEQAAD